MHLHVHPYHQQAGGIYLDLDEDDETKEKEEMAIIDQLISGAAAASAVSPDPLRSSLLSASMVS